MHDVLSTAITVATILGAAFFSNTQINSLRNEMHAMRSELYGEMHSIRNELNAKMDSLQRDMREFYAEQARHDTPIMALERASAQR